MVSNLAERFAPSKHIVELFGQLGWKLCQHPFTHEGASCSTSSELCFARLDGSGCCLSRSHYYAGPYHSQLASAVFRHKQV
jgi:hypothetical protein